MKPSDVAVAFAFGVHPEGISDYSMGVLRDAAAASNNASIQIDSLTRTPAQQARAMYENLESHGVAQQRALYTDHLGHPLPGCRVIDVYEQSKRDGHRPGDIVLDMTDMIFHLGPDHVSAHCGDPKVRQVIDVLRTRLANPLDFIAALRKDPRVSKVLDEDYNHAVHIEIPAPPAPSAALA